MARAGRPRRTGPSADAARRDLVIDNSSGSPILASSADGGPVGDLYDVVLGPLNGRPGPCLFIDEQPANIVLNQFN